MKSVYLLLITFATSYNAFSQSYIGLKMGFTVPAMVGTTENTDGYSSELNFNGGLVHVSRLHNDWYLQTEINYAPQSAVKCGLQPLTDFQYTKLLLANNGHIYANYKHRLRFTYLEFPVMIKFMTGEKLKFSFATGPYLGILLQARSSSEGISNIYTDKSGDNLYPLNGGSPVSLTNNITTTKNYRKLVAGLQAGLELMVPMCGGNAFLESRTTAGLTDINKKTPTAKRFYSGSFTMSAGYAFIIK
jgi:hypothetical protein